jgi:hypothetical protein
LTVFSLAAAGASDWGVQSVIFGTIKALTDEMNLGLMPEELANGTPSIRSLSNWEFDFAAGCMATIISQIGADAKRMMEKYNKKLQITLVTDHGNRKGVDHFIKQICWTSYEGDRHVLRHFNHDIDKGGHTTVDAANAIHKSLQSLHLDNIDDVEYSFICGDSGGAGAKVQSLHVLESGIKCPTDIRPKLW